MDIRYSASPNDVKRYTTEELRKEFLITDLYVPDTVKATYEYACGLPYRATRTRRSGSQCEP